MGMNEDSEEERVSGLGRSQQYPISRQAQIQTSRYVNTPTITINQHRRAVSRTGLSAELPSTYAEIGEKHLDVVVQRCTARHGHFQAPTQSVLDVLDGGGVG